ncbi:hypothetical protein DAPPUDRAFT_246083 [Daphnia pulex]|uniref:Uncharacterized protein n=1 Tax=Daphnia pulex TaxID=6669 RepID=E9GPL8_DAPPU|nr:hypothetical protein DAPPUDRAFT_246083 [Daphnia pulex]|eukprot:EFX78565.1 hypothetical protein DAPPUDRAFT_246083 [Daphnia pulex]
MHSVPQLYTEALIKICLGFVSEEQTTDPNFIIEEEEGGEVENQRKQRDKQHSINSQIMTTSRGK